jgi:hypothetical protein
VDLYLYVRNAPTDMADPLGLDEIDVEEGSTRRVVWVFKDASGAEGRVPVGTENRTRQVRLYAEYQGRFTNIEISDLRAIAAQTQAGMGNLGGAAPDIIKMALGVGTEPMERSEVAGIEAAFDVLETEAKVVGGGLKVGFEAVAAVTGGPGGVVGGSYLVVSGTSDTAGAFDPENEFVSRAYEQTLGDKWGPRTQVAADLTSGLVAGPKWSPAPAAARLGRITTLKRLADVAHRMASDPRRFRSSTVALAEVKLASGRVEVWASGSSGRLSVAQQQFLRAHGVTKIIPGASHAEQNIAKALPKGAKVSRWGISWAGNERPLPCSSCEPLVHEEGGQLQTK